MSSYDYARFQGLILHRTGMLFGPRRTGAMARGVAAMAEKQAQGDLDRYYGLLENTRTDSRLWDELVDELTISETFFFRDAAQFEVLRRRILPDLIQRHRQDRRLRIWSAGCASGEEPFSLAMLVDEMIPDRGDWNVTILATDINRQVLRKAETGIFRKWSFRQMSPILRHRYFEPCQEGFALRDRIRKMVTFAYLNLNEDHYPSLTTNTNAMDLICFRNVAIYQTESVVERVAERFYRCLLPGGWLVVGAAETSIPAYGRFQARHFSGSTVFQKNEAEDPIAGRFEAGRRGADIDDPFQASGEEIFALESEPESCRSAAEIPDKAPKPDASEEPVPPPPDATEGFYDRGLRLLQEKRFDEAIIEFNACLSSAAEDPSVCLQMARVQGNRGCLAEALSWCRRALDRDPLSPEAHYTYGLICLEQGDAASAVAGLKKAVYLDPDFVLAHFSLAAQYRRTGAMEKFGHHHRQAVRLASRLPEESVLTGSDDLTAGQLLTMAGVLQGPQAPSAGHRLMEAR